MILVNISFISCRHELYAIWQNCLVNITTNFVFYASFQLSSTMLCVSSQIYLEVKLKMKSILGMTGSDGAARSSMSSTHILNSAAQHMNALYWQMRQH